MTRIHRTALVLAGALVSLPLVSAPAPLLAQEEGPGDAAKAEELKLLLEKAEPLVWRGSYDAVKPLKQALELDPACERAAWLLATAQSEQGRTDEALSALEPFQESGQALTLAGSILTSLGRFAEADASFEKALAVDAAYVPALEGRGRVAEAQGRADDAIKFYRETNSAWAKSKSEDDYETLVSVGRARMGLFRLSDEFRVSLNSALERFAEAKKLEPKRAHALVEMGLLYLRNYQDNDAKAQFRDALELNPHYAPALDGAAQQLMFRYDDTEATDTWERAARENERYAPAHVALAKIALGDGDLDKAEKRIVAAEAAAPRLPSVRAVRAALVYLRDDKEGFEKAAQAILADTPGSGLVYRCLAEALEQQRRFAEALTLAERAVKVDDRDWEALFVAGRNAANVGDDAKAEEYLQRAEKDDIFHNIYRKNFLSVFEKLQSFPEHKDERFVVKLPMKEEAAYLPILVPTLDWSMDLLEKKWDFTPEFPIYVSVFDQQDDFAVRTVGLPGFPALGACFGRVVTLDSPRTRPPGPFGWRATLHHELAHVITLQLSRGRVPRWLTEGLSVYEERKVSPTWNRDSERDLIDAIASDEVLTLDDINNAFRGSRVLFAYYQGGLMCEWIERDWGFPKLREMVRLYGENLGTRTVVKRALGIDAEEFDERFLEYARDYVKDIHVMPRASAAKMKKLRRHLERKGKDDLEGWVLFTQGHIARGQNSDALSALGNVVRLAPEDPRVPALRALVAWGQKRPDQAVPFAEEAIAKGGEDYQLHMLLGQYYADPRQGDFEKAKAHYRRAIELYPTMGSPGSPRLLLAELLLGEGETRLDAAMKLIREHTLVAEDDVPSRMKLASYHRTAKRTDAELEILLEIRDVVPMPFQGGDPWGREQATELNRRIGEIYLERKDYAQAEVACDMAAEVAVMPTGTDKDKPLADDVRSDLLTRHAECLRLLGRTDAARRRVQEALTLDAENEDALHLLEALGPR